MDTAEFPRTPADLAAYLDANVDSGVTVLQTAFSRAFSWSESHADAVLRATVQVEGTAVDLFWHAHSLLAGIAERNTAFDQADLDYLERREQSTSSPRLRALYAHAIAWTTRRFDKGQIAVQYYIDAARHYIAMRSVDETAAERMLRNLAPHIAHISKQYRKLGDGQSVLVDIAQVSRAVLRLRVLELLIPESTLSVDQYKIVRSLLFATIDVLGGTSLLDQLLLASRLGIRLDSKYKRGEQSEWYEALLPALAKTATSGEHVVLREHAAQEAALVLQLLGREEERARMLALQRAIADSAPPSQVFGSPLDEDGSFARAVRDRVDEVLNENGEVGALAWIGLSAMITPRMQHARDAIEQQTAQGIGVFRQIVSTIARSRDNRVVGHSSPGPENQERALWEQFSWGCLYAWYSMDVFTRHVIANGSIRFEHMDALLRQSWIGYAEPNRPNELVDLLLAPIRSYFGVLTKQADADALIPAIDSLTLRLEAVLRKLARALGVADVSQRSDRQGRITSEVRGLSILDDDRLRKWIGEDLHALAKHTLVGFDEGLRDSVGHAITQLSDYGIYTAHSLVFLLLRIAVLQVPDPELNMEVTT